MDKNTLNKAIELNDRIADYEHKIGRLNNVISAAYNENFISMQICNATTKIMLSDFEREKVTALLKSLFTEKLESLKKEFESLN